MKTYDEHGNCIGEDFVDQKHLGQNYKTNIVGGGDRTNLTLETINDRNETINVR